MAKKKVKLEFDQERLTLGDLLALDEGNTRGRMEVLAKFVINGSGEYLDPEEGFEELKHFSIADLNRASEQFKDAAQGADSPK